MTNRNEIKRLTSIQNMNEEKEYDEAKEIRPEPRIIAKNDRLIMYEGGLQVIFQTKNQEDFHELNHHCGPLKLSHGTHVQQPEPSPIEPKLDLKKRHRNSGLKIQQELVDSHYTQNGLPKFLVVSSVGLLFLTLVVIQAYLVRNMTTGKPVLRSSPRPVMIARQYEEGKVYHNSFQVVTESISSNQTNIANIDYQMMVAVKLSLREETHFVGVLQKCKEQLYDINGTIIRETDYQCSDVYYRILKEGALNYTNQTTSNQSNISGQASTNQSNFSDYNETYRPQQPILPVFRFVLDQGGKIRNITFHKKAEKPMVGLMKNFIKMFSPSLLKDLYVEPRILSHSKHRLLQEGNATDNKINSSNSSNDSAQGNSNEKYNFETEEKSIKLSQVSAVNETKPSHNTVENSIQESNFSKEGELTEARLQSNTQFNSVPQPPSDNYCVHNFDLKFETKQTAKMNLLESFRTNKDYVVQFEALIAKYENESQTYSYSEEEVGNYIIGAIGEGQDKPGDIRLLLESDGSLKIVAYEKNVEILMTNLAGFQVGAYGYIELKLTLHQDDADEYKKIPKIVAGAGSVLALGFHKVKVPVMDYTKSLPPLTLKFTLKKIQSVVNLFKGDFIAKVIELSQLIINGQFERQLLPNIMKVVSLVGDVQNAVLAEENAKSPIAIIMKILGAVSDIRAIVDSKGAELLNPQNQFAQNITMSLFSYYNVSFAEALDVFNKVKGNLSLIRSQGSDYLSQLLQVFPTSSLASIEREIRSLIPAEVYQDYQKQMEKAKSIISFLTFVKEKGLEYSQYIQFSLREHEINMVGLVKGVVDLYFRNQTNITDTFTRAVDIRFGAVLDEFEKFKSMRDFVNVTNMKKRVQSLFETVLFDDLLNTSHSTYLREKFDFLERRTQWVSSEKGECCQYRKKRSRGFFRKKVCSWWNPAYGDQAGESNYLVGLRRTVEMSFNSFAQRVSDCIADMKDILQNNELDLVAKLNELRPRINELPYLVPDSNINDIINNILSRQSAAQKIRSRVGCGSTANLGSYISELGELANIVSNFRDRYNQIKQVGLSIVNGFDQSIYTAILDNTVIIEGATDLFTLYKNYEDQSIAFLNTIKQMGVTYNAKNFAQSPDTALQIFRMYGVIAKSLNELCLNKEENKTSVQAIRMIYEEKLKPIRNMSNVFLQGQLQRLQFFLGNASKSMFSVFLDTPFCQIQSQFENEIAILYPDFDNFTLLFELYSSMSSIKNETEATLAKMKGQMRGLSRNFFKLFTPDGYRSFIKRTQALAKEIENITSMVSLELSRLRESAKTIYMFQMSGPEEIKKSLEIFANSSFVLDSKALFKDLNQMVFTSLEIVEKLSFDVIAFVVAAKEVLEYFEGTVSNFTMGGKKIYNSFKDLCQSFLDVTALVQQQYLNRINSEFRNVIVTLNETVFPSITQNLNAIIIKFEGYEFKSKYLQELFNKSMSALRKYGVLLEDCKAEMFIKMKYFTDYVVKLIENLEIGSLNSILDLANVIKDEFSNFFSSFPSLLRELLDFRTFVDKDFRKIFSFRSFFRAIQIKVESRYNESMSRISEKIRETETSLAENSKFYSKFKSSPIHSRILSSKREFVLNFESLWKEADSDLAKIDQFLNEISGNVAQVLKEINDAKQKISGIKASVERRVKNIKQKYQQIRKKFFNIQALFFITLKGDLSTTVTQCLRSISSEIDNIIDIDLKVVDELAKSSLNGRMRLVSELILYCNKAYTILRTNREAFFGIIGNGINKIDEFVQNKLVSKFQKLKDGIVYINSLTNHEDARNRLTLWEHSPTPIRAPLFSFAQPIPTPIGVFYISLNLNYTLGARVFVGLTNFRDVDVGVTFSAALLVEINFSYGILNILEFGFYLRGTILRAQVTPALQFYGLIPIQLTRHISDITEISDENKLEVELTVDLGIYAVQIEVGFYIKHIWIDIIWLELDLCFDFWFFSFCIYLKIPIGFKFIFKRHDWGYKSNGIAILKKRILTLRIIQWKF